MNFHLKFIPSLIYRGLIAVGSSVRRYHYKYRTERYFSKVRKDVTKLNWYMIKSHYSRQDRRRMAQKIMKYMTSLTSYDWREKRRTP